MPKGFRQVAGKKDWQLESGLGLGLGFWLSAHTHTLRASSVCWQKLATCCERFGLHIAAACPARISLSFLIYAQKWSRIAPSVAHSFTKAQPTNLNFGQNLGKRSWRQIVDLWPYHISLSSGPSCSHVTACPVRHALSFCFPLAAAQACDIQFNWVFQPHQHMLFRLSYDRNLFISSSSLSPCPFLLCYRYILIIDRLAVSFHSALRSISLSFTSKSRIQVGFCDRSNSHGKRNIRLNALSRLVGLGVQPHTAQRGKCSSAEAK